MMKPGRMLTAFGILPFGLLSFGIASIGIVSQAWSAPLIAELSAAPTAHNVIPVLVFGKNSRRGIEDFAAENKLDPKVLRRTYAASGLIECGNLHGAGQLTLTDQVVTTAAHVFFDEKGMPTGKSCIFVLEADGKQIAVPIDLSSIVAGSTNPYAVAEVHDWAVARLMKPVDGVQPYGIAEASSANEPVEFVARGHVDWGEGRLLSMEKCRLHDQLAAGKEGTREFSFDCETGDGASGGAVLAQTDKPEISAILVGWTSNRPFHAAPFSPTHYNFVVTMEGAFRQAVQAQANKVIVAK
jgi:hypothetical protein